MLELEPIENQAMQMLLAGEHPTLKTLRSQFERSQVTDRKLTGIGFFTHFEILDDHPRIRTSKRMLIDDVCADVGGLNFGCGFIPFIEDGLLSTLECHLWGDDEMPDDARYTRLYYVHQPNPPGVTETKQRDMESLNELLAP